MKQRHTVRKEMDKFQLTKQTLICQSCKIFMPSGLRQKISWTGRLQEHIHLPPVHVIISPVCQVLLSVKAKAWIQMSCTCKPLNPRVPLGCLHRFRVLSADFLWTSRSPAPGANFITPLQSLHLSLFFKMEAADMWCWCFYDNKNTFTYTCAASCAGNQTKIPSEHVSATPTTRKPSSKFA